MTGFYNKCKNCARMKLTGHRCNSCLYTDPEEHRPDDPTCMCIECIPTPQEQEKTNATDTAETEPDFDPEFDELGEAG